MSDAVRLISPAAARNRAPILEALRRCLPDTGTVLEVASGSGEHVAHFAAALPGLCWQPSDMEAACRASIDAWAAGLSNILPACALDAAYPVWPVERADAVLCINMIHIAPWSACVGLVAGAARVLPAGGVLVLYGPYRWAGRAMEPSNAAFDADLRARNAVWGLRAVEDVARAAVAEGFGEAEIFSLPADNLLVVFRLLRGDDEARACRRAWIRTGLPLVASDNVDRVKATELAEDCALPQAVRNDGLIS